MQIFGPIRVDATQYTQAGQANSRTSSVQASKPPTSASPIDQLDLSSTLSQVSRTADSDAIAGGGEIRVDRVAEIRRSIANGTYDTPEKMDIALGRLLDRMG